MLRVRFVLPVVLLFILAFGYLMRTDAAALSAEEYFALSFSEQHTYWIARINQSGAGEAYEELARIVDGLSRRVQHDNGHIFGDALYEARGVEGITTCDSRFVYACFHAVVIRSILTSGLKEATRLLAKCDETFSNVTSCEHGIGHGILGVISTNDDYSLSDLEEALAFCDNLSMRRDLVFGCSGGVFMEYALRSMNSGTTTGRAFRVDEIFEPCESLPWKYAGACVYMQPRWWMEVHPDREDKLTMARNIGAWCVEMSRKDTHITESCISGIGHTITLLINEDPAQAAAICDAATTNLDDQYICQYSSAARLISYFPVDEALRACEGLPDKKHTDCREQALRDTEDIVENMKNDLQPIRDN